MKKTLKLAFIGAGNMGGALMAGLVKSKLVRASQITAVDVDQARLKSLKASIGVNISSDISKSVSNADLVVLAVKPQVMDEVFAAIGNIGSKAVLSIAAGVTISRIVIGLGGRAHVIRCMPNTPALVGAGIAALCAGPRVKASEMALAQKVLDSVGSTVIVKNEKLLDAVTGLSGSGPAYVFMVIEALADGGVLMGLDRATSLKLSAQTVLGSAKMVIETGKHPGVLKDMVTSPGGTTAHALELLEEFGVRGAFMAAVRAAKERSEELGKG